MIRSLFFVCAFALMLISCGSDKDEKSPQQAEEYVMSTVEDYVKWLNESGISALELENRICEVKYRALKLESIGDTILANKFLEAVISGYKSNR